MVTKRTVFGNSLCPTTAQPFNRNANFLPPVTRPLLAWMRLELERLLGLLWPERSSCRLRVALENSMTRRRRRPRRESGSSWAVGEASVEEIALLGLRPANELAMRRAIEKITHADFALVDAWTIPGLTIPQRGIIHGDALVKSIAAASIIAKVTRDRMMRVLHEQFPAYGFDVHKGYGTKAHLAAMKKLGLSEAHRVGWGNRLAQQKTSYFD